MDAERLVDLSQDSARRQLPLLHQAGRTQVLTWKDPPRPQASFGLVGEWVEVGATLAGPFARLIIPFRHERLGLIDPNSLRMFRFDRRAQRLQKLAYAVLDRKLSVLHAAIDRPGMYGLIGLNGHRLVSEAVRQLCQSRAAGVSAAVQENHRDRVCDQILCQGLTRPLPDDLVLTRPAHPGESPCERCREVDLVDLPECQILDEPADRPVHAVRWESSGPESISGAIRQVLVDPTDRRRLYAVSANGGIWRLDDVDRYPEVVWLPLTDGLASPRFRTMAVAPADGRVLYAANSAKTLSAVPIQVTSEIYASSDRGRTWRSLNQDGMGVVHRLVVHRTNTDVVWAATSTGLWRRSSADGGWLRVFPGDCLDVAADPDDSSVVYLGVRGRGVFKSFTFGSSWTSEPILPFDAGRAGARGTIKIVLGSRDGNGTVQTATSRTIVVRFGNEVCVSDQAGRGGSAAWRRMVPSVPGTSEVPNPALDLLDGGSRRRSDTNPRRGDEWCNCLALDPFDPNHLLVGSQGLLESTDGGGTWINRRSGHEDEHSLAFDDERPHLLYLANDGGVFSSINGGGNWPTMWQDEPASGRGTCLARGLVTAELRSSATRTMRAVAAIDHTGFVLSENRGRWQFLFDSAENSQRHAHESSRIFSCPASLERYYVINARGRDDPGRGAGRLAQVEFTHSDNVVDPPQFRFLSDAKAALPDGGQYFPEEFIYRQFVRGPLTARFSGGAGERLLLFGTAEEPSGFAVRSLRLGTGGATVTETIELTHPSEAFFALTFVPSDPDCAYVISQQGRLFTRDFSTSVPFHSVADWSLPVGSLFVSQLVPVTRPEFSLYALTQNAIGRLDEQAQTWSTVHTWPAPNESLLVLLAHPALNDTLFLGTSRRVYRSQDAGSSWAPYGVGWPSAPVTALSFDGAHLYAASFGRGLWRCQP